MPPSHSHSMVNGFEFALQLLGFLPTIQTHTNCDTTRVRALDSRIIYGDPSRYKRARIINELWEKATRYALIDLANFR